MTRYIKCKFCGMNHPILDTMKCNECARRDPECACCPSIAPGKTRNDYCYFFNHLAGAKNKTKIVCLKC